MPGREPCNTCGATIVVTPGMDAYTKVTDYTTTEYTAEYYCNRECLQEALDDA